MIQKHPDVYIAFPVARSAGRASVEKGRHDPGGSMLFKEVGRSGPQDSGRRNQSHLETMARCMKKATEGGGRGAALPSFYPRNHGLGGPGAVGERALGESASAPGVPEEAGGIEESIHAWDDSGKAIMWPP